MIWYKLKGAAKWIGCKASRGRRVSPVIALKQLDQCRVCESAQVRWSKITRVFFLSCGDPGKDGTMNPAPTCGCALGWMSRQASRELRRRGLEGQELATAVRLAVVPCGKTRCKADCDQGRWV